MPEFTDSIITQEIPTTTFIHCNFFIFFLPISPMKGTHPTHFYSNFGIHLKKTLQRKGSQPNSSGPTWTSVHTILLNSRNLMGAGGRPTGYAWPPAATPYKEITITQLDIGISSRWLGFKPGCRYTSNHRFRPYWAQIHHMVSSVRTPT